MKPLALLACALLAATPLYAADPSPESIEHLLKAANVQQNLTNMYTQMDGLMKSAMTQALKSENAGDDASTYAEAFSKKMAAQIRDEMSWAKMKDMYAKVYSESFSQEEVDGLIAFYESPAGKAFVAKMPTVMQKSMVMMQDRMGPMVQRMQKSLQDTLLEVQAKQGKK